jgi:hypothetical protein
LKKKLLKKKKLLRLLKRKQMNLPLHTEEQEKSQRNGKIKKERKETFLTLQMNNGHSICLRDT